MPGRFDQTEPRRSRFDQRDRSRSPGPKSGDDSHRERSTSTADAAGKSEAAAKAAEAAARISKMLEARKASAPAVPETPAPTKERNISGGSVTGEIYTQDGDYIKDIEVNDLRNRYTLTKGATQKMIKDTTGADVTTRGEYYPDKSMATATSPPLYLHITSLTKEGLEQAVALIEDLMQKDLPNLVDERRFRRREPEPFERDELGRRKWPEERIPLDMEPIPGFNLRAQVVGHGGAYVKHIQQETGCKVQIKGRGSGFIESNTGQESDEPMYLHVSAPQADKVERAKELCLDLMANVRQAYNEFKERGPRHNHHREGGGDRREGGGGYGGGGRYDRNDRQGGRDNYNGGGGNHRPYNTHNSSHDAAGGYGQHSPAQPGSAGAAASAAGGMGGLDPAQHAQYVEYYRANPDQDPYIQYGGYEHYAAWYMQQYAAAAAGAQSGGASATATPPPNQWGGAAAGGGGGYAAPPPPPDEGGAPPPPPPGGDAPPPPPPPPGGAGGYNAVPPPPGM